LAVKEHQLGHSPMLDRCRGRPPATPRGQALKKRVAFQDPRG
jgi:hypothetical protein